MEHENNELRVAVNGLSAQTARVADALEKQVGLKRRFVTGVVFGVGTALGASIIATVVVLGLAWLLAPIGIDLVDAMREARDTFEHQIELQTPQ